MLTIHSFPFCLTTIPTGLQWVSAFEGEEEILFNPLTYLQATTGKTEVVEVDGMRLTVIEVVPTIA